MAAFAQDSYPAVCATLPGDIIYDQLEDSIEHFHQGEKTGQSAATLSLYSYTVPEDADIFSVAAAFSLPYAAIASLNRLRDAETIARGTRLLIPSQPGICVPESPENDLELLMKSLWHEAQDSHCKVRAFVGGRDDRPRRVDWHVDGAPAALRDPAAGSGYRS
jgi:hypothetical protein